VRQQHSISIFCSPCEWPIDPFHSLASQLIANPYCASRQVFSQISDSNTDTRIAAHINRVLKSAYDYDLDSTLTSGLQSHSTRRGGAAHASSHNDIKLPDLAHRGLWSMDGYATILEYISPTSSSDHRIAKVLGGWADPSKAGIPPSLSCLENEGQIVQEKVAAFAQYLHHQSFSKITQKGFADCLTATMLMYLDDTIQASASHIIHEALSNAACVSAHVDLATLSSWGRVIRKRFILDNLHALPVDVIKRNLDEREFAARHIGVHTFAESLERCVIGYRELCGEVQDLKGAVLALTASLRGWSAPQQSTVPLATAPPCSDPASRPFHLGVPWPADFTTVRALKLQDLVVRYVRDNLAAVAFSQSNRLHKEVSHAIQIIKHFADMSTIPISTPANTMVFNVQLAAFARDIQHRVVAYIEAKRPMNHTGKRKRSISGSVSGVVRAWGELTELDRSAAVCNPRVEFAMPP
jgi:hypothetical protein